MPLKMPFCELAASVISDKKVSSQICNYILNTLGLTTSPTYTQSDGISAIVIIGC
jgi:hypothetical protein